MKQTKKLGRGLEDFSHLFISSPAETKKPLEQTRQDSLMQEKGVIAPARAMCIVSHKPLDERSFLVINLTLEIARQGMKIIVLDGDFSTPRLSMMMEGFTPTPLAHLNTHNGKAVGDVHETDEVTLITLDVDLSSLSALGQDERRTLIENFNKLEERSDMILVVASPRYMQQMKPLLHAVDEVMVITPHPLPEMINSYGLIKRIFQLKENARVGIVSSNVTNALQADSIFEKMNRVVKKFLHKPLYNYGFMPDDGELRCILKKQHSLHDLPPTKLFKSITDIRRTIFEMDAVGSCDHTKDSKSIGFAEKLFDQLVSEKEYK